MKKMTEADLRARVGEHVAPAGLYNRLKEDPFLGTVSCNIAVLEAGAWTELLLQYTVGPAGMADGSVFKAAFRFYSDWALFQTTNPLAANYVSAEYQAGPLLPGQSPATVQAVKVRFDQKGHERPFQKAIIVDIVDGYLKAGDRLLIRLGDRRHGGPGTRAQTFVEENFRMRCYVDPLGTSRFAAIPDDVILQIVPGSPARLVVVGSRLARPGAPLVLRVRIEDGWGNTCRDRALTLAVEARRDGETVFVQDALFPAQGWSVVEIRDLPVDRPGELAVSVALREYPLVKADPFYLTIDPRCPGQRIYYADLHVHSEDTIGTNSTSYNLSYGRDVSGLDVLAFAHNDFNITKARWDKTVSLIEEINDDGAFVAYPGVEWCGSSCAGGDHNVVYLHGRTPEFPYLKTGEHVRSFEWNEDMGVGAHIEPGAWPLEELWAAYAADPQGHLLIPHVGGRRCVLDWHHPELERLIEIGSSWGHFGWLYQEAMERGYKIGASMAGDEHRGRCGGGVPGTAVFGTKGGMAGVIAPELTRAAIAKALRARHTFACTGERTVGLSRCGDYIQGDEFVHRGAASIDYRFLGDAGWDEIAAYDDAGVFWRRNLQEELGYSDRKIRIRWGGARIKDRYRVAAWRGTITIRGAVIEGFAGRGFEHQEESCWREGATRIGFKTDTYGDADGIEIDCAGLAQASIRIEGTIDGYVKVGDPTQRNAFEHCPTFDWEVSGDSLLRTGAVHHTLPGVDMFIACERMSDHPAPRDVSGRITVPPRNGPHGFRPVYFLGRQVDDAKVWTSALFITFAD